MFVRKKDRLTDRINKALIKLKTGRQLSAFEIIIEIQVKLKEIKMRLLRVKY